MFNDLKHKNLMRTLYAFCCLLGLSFLIACGGEVSTNTANQDNNNQQDTSSISDRGNLDEQPLRSKHDCEISGKVLEDNAFWIRDKEILICVVADSTTYDADMGDSHRIVEVYNTEDCSRIAREVLPVNVSADFPYYLAEITYNKNSQIVAIKGFSTIYCYDVANKKLLSELTPVFLSEREAADAQSGMIKHLEVWEDYLLGYALDFGSFAFDLRDRQNPKSILPFAEYQTPQESFTPMFLFPSENELSQLVMPTYNVETDEFSINPILDSPLALSTNIPKSARNNRYLVLRSSSGDPIAVDLLNQARVELPSDIATKNTQEILKWMREAN